MTITTIYGDSLSIARYVKPGTLQHWDELSKDQSEWSKYDSEFVFGEAWFYVADFPLYTARGGKPVLALARHTKEHPNNLLLKHLFDRHDSSLEQLSRSQFTGDEFHPNPDEAKAVLEAADTLKIEMAALRFSRGNEYCRSLDIRTNDGFVLVNGEFEKPTEVEEALKQRVGYTERFLDVLNKELNISITRVKTLNPEYVIAKAGEQFIGSVAWRHNLEHGLGSFTFPSNGVSGYYGNVVGYNNSSGGLRGEVHRDRVGYLLSAID